MRLFQQGSVNLPYETGPLDLDIEVSYAGFWHSVNDHVSYRAGIEGFGSVEQTWRRREVTSEYFQGSYSAGQVRDNTKRTLLVYVRGQSMADMVESQLKLIDWFTQDTYDLRIRTDDLLQTMSCDCADYRVDMSHVLMHNRMCSVAFSYSVHPQVSSELVL